MVGKREMNIKFSITFLGPFAVSTGQAGRSADSMVDDERPLPETSMKGLMRASAVVLQIPPQVIRRVFGSGKTPTAWNWGPVEFAQQPARQLRGSTAIDSHTNVARNHALLFEEQHWSTTATFDIQQVLFLDPADVDLQRTILAVAASGVQSIGKSRRRGNGWVSIIPVVPLTPADRTVFDGIYERSHP